MTEWRECKLKELADFNPDSLTAKSKLQFINYLDTGNITKGKIDKIQYFNLLTDKVPSRAKRIVKKNDIIYSAVRPNQEHYGIIKNPVENMVVSTGFVVLRAKEDKCYSDFLYYFLTLPENTEYLSNVAEDSTTAYPSITPDIIMDMDISLPPLPEQIAIAEVLSSLDDKIDLLTRQNKTLEDLAQAYFRKWFIEDASDKWEEIPLGQLFVISSGKGLKKEKFTEHGQYRVLGANGEIGKTNEYLFNERLIYTGRVGTLGNVFIVDREPVWLSDNTLVFRNIKYFFFVYFSLKWANLADYNVGSTQPLIRQSDIKEIRVFMPDKERLDSFENLANSIFAKINSNQKQIQLLQKLRDTLLPKLISGEIRVKM